MSSAPYEFDGLLLSRVRLGVIAMLIQCRSATFPELKDALAVTQGNLGNHLDKLERAGYVTVTKDFVRRRPRTTVRITPRGRVALRRHVSKLADVAFSPPAQNRSRSRVPKKV